MEGVVKSPRHVYVIPGFTNSDMSMQVVHGVLKKHGIVTHNWGNSNTERNIPFNGFGTFRDRNQRNLDWICDETGSKIDIVGFSLGGLDAIDLARDNPDKVDRVFTLGSPVNLTVLMQYLDLLKKNKLFRVLYEAGKEPLRRVQDPIEQPVYSRYSALPSLFPRNPFETDGVVYKSLAKRNTDGGNETNERLKLPYHHLGLIYFEGPSKEIANAINVH